MTIRVLELAKQLKVGTDDLLAVCTLLEIPATSRISCLNTEHIKKLFKYYEQESRPKINQRGMVLIAKSTHTRLEDGQPWRVWTFVAGLNLVAWIGWYFTHDAPSKWQKVLSPSNQARTTTSNLRVFRNS